MFDRILQVNDELVMIVFDNMGNTWFTHDGTREYVVMDPDSDYRKMNSMQFY